MFRRKSNGKKKELGTRCCRYLFRYNAHCGCGDSYPRDVDSCSRLTSQTANGNFDCLLREFSIYSQETINITGYREMALSCYSKLLYPSFQIKSLKTDGSDGLPLNYRHG